jgi:hypothetical protein
MSSKVKEAINRVRASVSAAGGNLSPIEYREFLEELCADAEGWDMQIREMDQGDED